MKDKNLLWIGAAAIVTLLAGFGVIAAISSKTETSEPVTASHSTAVPSTTPTIITQNPPMSSETVAAPVVTPALPPQMVKDSELQALATKVDLKGTIAKGPDKAEWAKAIPAAEALSSGPCDCQQRVWLNNFLDVAHKVVSGSADYKQSAEFLASLPKSYDEVMARQSAQASR